MTDEELDNEMRDMLPVDILSEDEFEEMKHLTRLEFAKSMKKKNIPDMGLKMCVWYHDFYKDKEYAEEKRKRELVRCSNNSTGVD